MLHKIYEIIEEDKISITVEPFNKFPENLSYYTVAYVGKHKKIQPNSNDNNLHVDDMYAHLLIECRLFTEYEEIYIFPKQGLVWQRVIKPGNEVHKFIEKSIQLRNEKNQESDKNDVLTVRHYLDNNMNGYSIMRYIKINK